MLVLPAVAGWRCGSDWTERRIISDDLVSFSLFLSLSLSFSLGLRLRASITKSRNPWSITSPITSADQTPPNELLHWHHGGGCLGIVGCLGIIGYHGIVGSLTTPPALTPLLALPGKWRQ